MDNGQQALQHQVEKEQTPPSDELRFQAKREAIQRAILEHDTDALVQLADSAGGLVDNLLRQIAWPILLSVNQSAQTASVKDSWQSLPEHPDEEQVEKDVDRAFVYYPKDHTANALNTRKTSLSGLITRLLRTYPMLCYFQGYHDIAAVLLLVLHEDAAFYALANLSLFRIRDYMLPTIKPAEKHLLLIPAILRLADPPLALHIERIPVFYALAGTLTLYAHDVPDFGDITRLYDFLLAHEPVMAIYLFASIIIHRRKELLDIPTEDSDMIHFTLTKLSHQLDLENLIIRSKKLFEMYPPEKLPGRAWASVAASSVLKTSRDIFRKQSVIDAERAIEQQKKILAWEARRHKVWMYLVRNRRPILSASTAILVAVASIWLRRQGHDLMLLSTMQRIFLNGRKT